MIAFDTNYLLRHLLQDDMVQSAHVDHLIQEQVEAGQSVLILDLVIMETCWVLMKVYKMHKEAWCEILGSLLSDPVFEFENTSRLRQALNLFENGKADFTDYMILANAQSHGATLETFD